jgi:hypothetical protein
MPYIHVDAADVLDEIDDYDLIEELKSRGHAVLKDTAVDEDDIVRVIYEKRRLGKDYQVELEQLIYERLGRVI